MTVRTPLGRVRGHGSAKSGTMHFWHQRLSAIVLLPLTLWFVWAVVGHVGAPHADVLIFPVLGADRVSASLNNHAFEGFDPSAHLLVHLLLH